MLTDEWTFIKLGEWTRACEPVILKIDARDYGDQPATILSRRA
jgi:hypothetical protein